MSDVEPDATPRSAGRALRVTACVAAWLLACVAGSWAFLRYNFEPTDPGSVRAAWPEGSSLRRDGRPTLLLFAHERCPCTRASLDELARVMASCAGRVDARVLLCRPEGADPATWKHELRERATSIEGVTVLGDESGREAARFGVESSGHVVLYDPSGHLLFSGGITGSRGHAGDNASRRALVAAIDATRHGQAEAGGAMPVFGCALRTPSTRAASR